LSAAGSDVLDLAVLGFSDLIDVSFFKGGIFDLAAACSARTGDGLYTYGVLKERSTFAPSMLSPTFIDCAFVDVGPSPNDPCVRVAQTRVVPTQIQSLAGLSGAAVYNVRTETVCGMVVRGGLERVGGTRRSRNLIAGGHLRTVTAINPVNRCPTVIVPSAEIKRFEREFVSLFALAQQQGKHFRAVKKELEAAGVKPAMKAEQVGATFYRRCDLAAAFPQAV
jgi:hypothetical protein